MPPRSVGEIISCTPWVQWKLFCALQEYKGNCSVHSWSMRKIVPCIPGVRGKLFHALLEYEKKLFRTLLEYEEYCSANSWSCLGHCRSTWEIFQHILGGTKDCFMPSGVVQKYSPHSRWTEVRNCSQHSPEIVRNCFLHSPEVVRNCS